MKNKISFRVIRCTAAVIIIGVTALHATSLFAQQRQKNYWITLEQEQKNLIKSQIGLIMESPGVGRIPGSGIFDSKLKKWKFYQDYNVTGGTGSINPTITIRRVDTIIK